MSSVRATETPGIYPSDNVLAYAALGCFRGLAFGTIPTSLTRHRLSAISAICMNSCGLFVNRPDRGDPRKIDNLRRFIPQLMSV